MPRINNIVNHKNLITRDCALKCDAYKIKMMQSCYNFVCSFALVIITGYKRLKTIHEPSQKILRLTLTRAHMKVRKIEVIFHFQIANTHISSGIACMGLMFHVN